MKDSASIPRYFPFWWQPVWIRKEIFRFNGANKKLVRVFEKETYVMIIYGRIFTQRNSNYDTFTLLIAEQYIFWESIEKFIRKYRIGLKVCLYLV